MIHISPAQFDDMVQEAAADLPAWVAERLDNVAIMTAQHPTAHQRQASRIGPGQMLLGLYEGVPLSSRGRGYHLRPPDRITLFQRALESIARDGEDLVRLIRRTIIHEIGHHFGMNEDELRDAGV